MNPRSNKIWFVGKDDLVKILDESKTISEILTKIGVGHSTYNKETLRSRCREDNIDYEYYEKRRATKRGFAYRLNEVMVENSNYARGCLKKQIIRQGLIPHECEVCGIKDEWNGLPLTLVLDHRNGVHNDHRYDNLRFLCPNCNSQQPTFAGRNQKYRSTPARGKNRNQQ